MADLNVPVNATQAVTRMQMSITAAYNAAGDAVTSTMPTEQLEIINIRSAQWPIEYRVGSGPWESIQEGKSRVVPADLSAQTVRIRRGLNAPPTIVADLVLYAKPTGLNSGQSGEVPVQGVVSPDGNVTSAALPPTTGTDGQIVRISDGDDEGALLMWTSTTLNPMPSWRWWLWPDAAYL